MNIFVAGGGRVGYHLARLLSLEHHDVTVIEREVGRVEQIDYALDVATVKGNAASVLVQQEAGVDAADLFVSVTGDDEVNFIAAATAKGLGAKKVVARVDNPVYIEDSPLYETILGIDYILSPDALTALDIVRYIESPGLLASEDFGRGKVQVRQFRADKTPLRNGQTLKDLKLPEGVLLGVISRDGKAMVPQGDATVRIGDLVTFVGMRESIEKARMQFQDRSERMEKVIIMGGQSIGLHLAQTLENRNIGVKLFDWDLQRCRHLAAKLKKTKVVCRDATTRVSLEQEHVAGADLFVATTSEDDRNLMASVLAKEVGAHRAVAVVHQPDFAALVSKLGIDDAVTPRACIANRILRLAHSESKLSLAVMQEGDVEIMEYAVEAGAKLTEDPLKDLRIPKETLVAAILRGDDVTIPRGDDQIQAGDSVVIILKPEKIDAVQKMLRP